MPFFRWQRLRLRALIALVLALAVRVINLLGSASVVNDLVAGTGFPGEFIADLRAFGAKQAVLVFLFTLAIVAGETFWARWPGTPDRPPEVPPGGSHSEAQAGRALVMELGEGPPFEELTTSPSGTITRTLRTRVRATAQATDCSLHIVEISPKPPVFQPGAVLRRHFDVGPREGRMVEIASHHAAFANGYGSPKIGLPIDHGGIMALDGGFGSLPVGEGYPAHYDLLLEASAPEFPPARALVRLAVVDGMLRMTRRS